MKPSTEPVGATRTVSFSVRGDRREHESRAYDKHGADANPCCVCGRQTDGTRWVHVTGGYSEIVHPADWERECAENEAAYMGSFPIGPDCARREKVPADFVERAAHGDAS